MDAHPKLKSIDNVINGNWKQFGAKVQTSATGSASTSRQHKGPVVSMQIPTKVTRPQHLDLSWQFLLAMFIRSPKSKYKHEPGKYLYLTF